MIFLRENKGGGGKERERGREGVRKRERERDSLFHLFMQLLVVSFFKIILKILFIHFYRGEQKEKEERNINVWLLLVHPILGTCPATQTCALTRN